MDERRPAPPRNGNDGAWDDLVVETQMLRRKLNFWQRTVWLLVGAVVILGTVVWQRGELRRRECLQALQYYAEQARRDRLGRQDPAILEQQWQSLNPGPAKLSPIHYDLIVQNWLATPKADEKLPLAVCRESHFLMLSRGRHVLFRDPKGEPVEWMSEDAAMDIVAQALKDNRTK
jgi:hypothetical protein